MHAHYPVVRVNLPICVCVCIYIYIHTFIHTNVYTSTCVHQSRAKHTFSSAPSRQVLICVVDRCIHYSCAVCTDGVGHLLDSYTVDVLVLSRPLYKHLSIRMYVYVCMCAWACIQHTCVKSVFQITELLHLATHIHTYIDTYKTAHLCVHMVIVPRHENMNISHYLQHVQPLLQRAHGKIRFCQLKPVLGLCERAHLRILRTHMWLGGVP
jgi:hypothetical protein